MPRSWERENATGVLTGTTTEQDPLPTPQANHNWIAEATIRAAYPMGPIGQGGRFIANAYHPPAGLTGDALRDQRRRQLARRIREWQTSNTWQIYQQADNLRAKAFERVCEAHTRAILVDANLTTAANYNTLRLELDKDPERFVWKMQRQEWYNDEMGGQGYYGPQITGQGVDTWTYHVSGDLDANDTADNVQGTADSSIGMTQTALDWVSEIAKLTN